MLSSAIFKICLLPSSHVWCHTLVFLTPRRLKQDDYEFEVCLGYRVRHYLNKQKSNRIKQARLVLPQLRI